MAGGTGGLRSVRWLPVVVALVVIGSGLWVYGDPRAHVERVVPSSCPSASSNGTALGRG
jgi:hypothetical protein